MLKWLNMVTGLYFIFFRFYMLPSVDRLYIGHYNDFQTIVVKRDELESDCFADAL